MEHCHEVDKTCLNMDTRRCLRSSSRAFYCNISLIPTCNTFGIYTALKSHGKDVQYLHWRMSLNFVHVKHVVKLCFDVSLFVCSHLNHLENLLRLYCNPYCSEYNWTNDIKTITLLINLEVVLNELLNPFLNISTTSKD